MTLRMVEMTAAAADVAEFDGPDEELAALGMWRESLDDDLVRLRILVPNEKTEAVIHQLESQFQGSPGFRIVLLEVQATVPPPPEVNQNQPEEKKNVEDAAQKESKDPQRIACAELVQELGAAAVVNRIYLLTVVLSTVVAATGLIRDNVAVIIGAMVIAPLLGPNITLALATTLGDAKLARKALRVIAVGLLLAFLLAAAIGSLLPFDVKSHEISSRTNVGLSDIVIALAAGSAGVLAFTTGLSSAVVGVMVAVALLPPLVVTGLLVGVAEWQMAAGSLLLLATNIICVNLAGVGTFLWQGVQPRHWWEAKRAQRMIRIAAAIWIGLLCLLVFLILLGQR